MTKKEINDHYIDKFIHSLENDMSSWKLSISSGMDGSFYEYRSPDYVNEAGTKTTFGFGTFSTGAWIDGLLSWREPFMNPFSKKYRRLKKAKAAVRLYLETKLEMEYNEILESAL